MEYILKRVVMAKNPVFYVLTAFILLSATLVAPSAHAALSMGDCLDGNKYFHLKCSGTAGSSSRYCNLSQTETTNPEDGVDYACWFNVWDVLENSDNKSSQIILEDDLDFGGYDDSKGACAVTFTPIGSGHSFDGLGKTIKGFCYSAANAGFFETLSGKEFKNVTFENPYVIGQYAGVVASTIQDASKVSYVTIKNASLFGVQLGGLAAVVKYVNNSNENAINNVTIDGLSLVQDRTYLSQAATFYMGSAVGYVNNAKVSVSNANVDNISVVFPGSATLYLGGFFGETYNSTVNVSNSIITSNAGLEPEGTGNLYVGGVVGENYASHLTVNKFGFNGNLSGSYAGGILGYLKDFTSPAKNSIIKNTYTVGEIKGTTSAGYIIGYLEAVSSLDQKDSLYHNFHFGTDAVSEGVGNYAGTGNWGYSWPQGTLGSEYVADQGNIFGNVRNASSGLTPNESFGFHFNVLHDTQNNVLKSYMDFFEGTYNPSSSAMWPMVRVANGIVKAADMESGLFAALMNYNLERMGQNAIWISDGGLPTFANGTDKPNHLVILETSNLYLNQTQENDLTIKNQSIRDSSVSNNSGMNPPDRPESVKKGIVSYTDASGSLNSDFLGNVTKLIDDGKDNLGVNVVLEDGSGNSVSLTETFDTYQMLRFSIPNMFFCFKENGTELVFHQVASTTPDDETCFDTWYHDDGSGNDAYSYAQAWLDNTDNGSVVLTSNVVFAGSTNTVCADGPNAFKGKYLELGSGDSFKSEDGNRHKIIGLCYVSSTARESVGFVKTNAATSRIENIAFSNVYFKLTGNNTNAGVALFNVSPSSIDGISVESSEFRADSVGAIAGVANEVENISNITLSGVKLDGKFVGSVFGYVSASNNVSFSKIAVEGSSDGFINSTNYAGGLVGRMNALSPLTLSIKNTYTRGNITCSNSTVGFLVSDLENSGRFAFDIINNYHYGTDDVSVSEGIHGIGWISGFVRNFRNSISGTILYAEGDLEYAEKPIAVATRGRGGAMHYYNGVISAAQMKSARFAAVLNIGGAANWTIDAGNSPKNDGLPFLVDDTDDTYKPIYAIGFDLAYFDEWADAKAKQNLEDALYYEEYQYESIDANGTQGIVLYTNSRRKLSTEDVNFVNSLLTDVATDSWEGSKVLSDAQTYTENMTYTYTSTRKVRYFCFREYTDNLFLSHYEYTAPPNSGTCYAYWYDEYADHSSDDPPDAYSFAQKWLDERQNGGNIYIASDITFAGRSGDYCIDAPNAFKGKYLTLDDGRGLYSQPSERHVIYTISGLCYNSSSARNIGFVEIKHSNAGIGDIAFSDVFFKLTGSSYNTSAGLVMLQAQLDLLSDIRVFRSVFQASYAGSILGTDNDMGVGRLENITVDSDTITSSNYAGAVAGIIHGVTAVKGVYASDCKLSILRSNGIVITGGSFGGIAGYVANTSVASLSVSNVSVYNVAMDAVNSSQMGGVFGHLDAGAASSFQGITVSGDILGSLVGGLVGEIWYRTDVAVSIKKTRILAHLWTAYDSDKDVLGGLIGKFDTRAASAVGELNINHNFITGALESQKSQSNGYLLGSTMDNVTYNVTDNYYYRNNNISPQVGIVGIADWNNPSLSSSIITRNFRNAVDGSLEKDGDLQYATKPIKNGDGTFDNGVIPGEQMKSARFAAVLNTDEAIWTIDEGDSPFNDGLPYFSESSYRPIYVVRFDLNNFNELTADESHRNILNEAISHNYYSLENVDGTHKGIMLFTSNSGKLNDNDYNFVNSLLDKEASWVGSPTWNSEYKTEYRANTIYTYNASTLMNIVNHFCTANDGNDGCDMNTDNDLSGTSGLEVEGYSIGYLLPPLKTYRLGQANSLIPPLMVSDGNSVKSYLPASYMINSLSPRQNAKAGNLWGMVSDYSTLSSVIQSLDYSVYENTIHLYYVNGVGASTNIKVANDGTTDYVVNGLAFDADGALNKQVYGKSIPAGSYVTLPVTPVIMLEKAPYGFNLDWSLEFSYKTATNTNLVDNSYLVENSNVFASKYTTDSWKIENRTENDKVHLDSIYTGLLKAFALSQTNLSQADFMITITPTLTPSNYSVTFDWGDKFHKDTLLVFSDRAYSQWDDAKLENVDMLAGKNFSRVYIYTKENATFQSISWTHDNQSSGYSELSSALLENATGGDVSITDLSLYPVRGSSIASPGLINVFAYDGDGNLLTSADDYHGNVVLSQKIGNVEFKQESHFESDVMFRGENYKNSDGLNVPNSPKLFFPSLGNDTLTFDVSAKADPGYSMNVLSFTHGWDNAPANEGWGYDANTNKLKIHTEKMQDASPPKVPDFDYPQFTVEFIPLHYNIEFSIPNDMRDGDVFIANKKVINGADETYEVDWFATQDDVTATSVKVPPLYDANGCRINWKPDGALHDALDIKEELQYLDPVAGNTFVNNVLVPDANAAVCPASPTNPNDYRASIYVMYLDQSSDKGKLFFTQKLAYPNQAMGTPDSFEIKHELTQGSVYASLQFPLVNDGNDNLGVKLRLNTEANDGYVLDKLYYETVVGNGTVPINLQNGSEFDFTKTTYLYVKFIALDPVYVKYDLSLPANSADSANVNLPVDAAPMTTLKIDTDKDSVEFWKPFRSDKCFMGWSEKSTYTTGDSLYKVLSANNYYVFENSTDESSAKTLYAVWQDCSNLPAPQTPTVALKNNIEHATLALYQKFGDTKIYHMVPSGTTVSLAGDAFDFYVDESETVMDPGYSLDENATLEVTYKDDALEDQNATKAEDAWRISTVQNVSLPTYSFAKAVKPVNYTITLNDNSAGKAFFGDSWTQYIKEGAFSADATNGNWNVTVTVDIENNKAFPMALYQNSRCLQGYALTATNATEVFTELNSTLLSNCTNGKCSSADPLTLYAVWGTCSSNMASATPLSISFAGTDFGDHTLERTFDLNATEKATRVYQNVTNLNISNANDDVSFTKMSYAFSDPDDGIVDPDALYQYQDQTTFGSDSWADVEVVNNLYTMKHEYTYLSAPTLNNSYEFAYNRNVAVDDTAKVFFGTPRKVSDLFKITDAAASVALPLDVMARTDACLTGWTLDKAGTENISLFDIVALRKLASLVDEGKNVDSLYAVWTAAGDDDASGVLCEPKKFKVTTNVPAAKGEFKVYQVIGSGTNDTLWYKVFPGTNGGVEIPTIEGMKLGVKFSDGNGYTAGEDVSVNDGSTIKTVTNGDMFEVEDNQSDVSLEITTTAVTYHFAFNENDVGQAYFGDSWADIIKATANSVSVSTDGNSNWIVKASYSLGGQTQFPKALYREDKCLVGYTFETGTTEYYTELNDLFIDKFNRLGLNPASTTTLYALWGDCETAVTGETVKLAHADKGSYTFSRKFAYGTANDDSTDARVYEIASETFVIPSDNKDVSFTNVEFKVNDGVNYILDTEKKISVKAKGDDADWSDYTAGDLLSVKNNKVDSVKAPILKNRYTFNYDRNFNDGKAVFYSPSMKISETYAIANVTQSRDLLPTTVMGRTDACLSGWTLDKDDPTAKIDMFDVVALRKINEREAAGKSVNTLYAVWDNAGENGCTPKTFSVTSGMNASQGSFQVYQYVEGIHTATVEYDVGNGIEIPTVVNMNLGIKFTGASTYSFGTEITVKEDISGNEKTVDNGSSITVADNQKNLTLYVEGEPVKFFFAFNENAADFEVKPYFGDSWQDLIDATTFSEDLSNGNWSVTKDYTVESPLGFPMDLYSNSLCLQGYGFTENSYVAFTELTDAVIAKYNEATPNLYSSTNPMPLYAVWGACTSINGVSVNFENLDKGKYVFSRTFSKGNFTTPERIYEVTSANAANGYTIPSDNDDISFTDWKFNVDQGASYIVDTDSLFTYRKDASSDWNKIAKGRLFTITENVKNVNAPLLTNTYKFAYSANADSVFFAPSAEMEDVTYSLADASASENLKTIDVMARANACLDGWSLDKAGSVKIGSFNVAALRTIDSLVKEGAPVDTLYAVWNTGSGCTQETFTVTTETPASKGTFEVYSVIGSAPEDTLWYKVDPSNSGVEIPTIANMMLGVKFTGAVGYTFGSTVFADTGAIAKINVDNGKTFKVKNGQKDVVLSVDADVVIYNLAFHENDDGTAYFGDSWADLIKVATTSVSKDNVGNWIVKANYTLESQNKNFPMALYREGQCLKGYTFETSSTEYYTELNDDFINAFNNQGKDPALTTVLYALWGACASTVDGDTIKLVNADKGTYRFSRKFDLGTTDNDSTFARTYESTSENFVLPSDNKDISFTNVEFTVNDGFGLILDTDRPIALRAAPDTAIWREFSGSELLTVNTRIDSVRAPLLKNSYTFTYDKNFAKDSAVFYSPNMKGSVLYSIENVTQSKNLQSFNVMARTDACVVGWSLTKNGNAVIGAFDAEALRKLDSLTAENQDVSTLYAVWNSVESGVCELNTFTVTSDVPASQGSFQLYRLLGADTTWYNMGANGSIEIPTLAKMPLGFKFTGVSTYEFGSSITISNADGDVKEVANGDTIYVVTGQKNLTLGVDAKAVKYFFALNENSDGKAFFGDSWQSLITSTTFKKAFDDNWIVTTAYTVESAEKNFPTALYSDGQCLQGYTLAANDKSDGLFTDFNDNLIAKYQAAGSDSTHPLMLYAYWGACSATNSVTVKLADTDKGKYTFTRTFDLGDGTTAKRTYTVATENFVVPSARGDIAFDGIQFVVGNNAGVILDTDAKFSVKGTAATDSWVDYTDGNMLTVGSGFGFVKAPLLKNSYTFTYDKNFAKDSAVFYSPNLELNGTYTLADVSESKDLQSRDVMGRADACLTGWALKADGSNAIDVFDATALRTINALEASGKDVGTLYAIWTAKGSDCTPKTFKVTTPMPAEQGSFQLYRLRGDDTTWYNVGTNGIEIPTFADTKLGVKFTAASPAYTFGSDVIGNDDAGNKLFSTKNGKTFDVVDEQKNVSLSVSSNAVEYTFAFNENASGEAFFGDVWDDFIDGSSFSTDNKGNWIVTASYSVNSANKSFPMAMYRNGYCMTGYTFTATDNDVFTELDDDFIRKFAALGKTSPTTLYAHWDVCSEAGTTVKLADTDKGKYTFTRTFDLGNVLAPAKRTYEAATANFVIPSSYGDVSFDEVSFDVTASDVILDTDAKFSVKGTASTANWMDYTNGYTLTVGANLGSVKAPLLKNSYTFTYDKNYAKDSAVFYSPDMKFSGTYTLASVADSKPVQPTTVMGRADACLTGWALDKAGDTEIAMFDATALRTINALEDAGKNVGTLYAVWTNAGEADASGTVCKPTTFKVASDMPEDQGRFKLYRVLDTDTTWYNVGTNGIEIPTLTGMKLGVKFTALSPAYTFGDKVSVDVGGTAPISFVNGKTFEVAASQKKAQLSVTSNAVEYMLAFNENDKGAAYFGNSWNNLISSSKFSTDANKNWVVTVGYSVDMNDAYKKFPMAMYRDGSCMQGYTFVANDKTNGIYTELNDAFIAKFAALGKNSANTMLYAYWEECTTAGTTVKLADTDKGSYKFTRTFALNDGKIAERTYEATTANFVVPSKNNDVSFNAVAFNVNSTASVILDTDAQLSVKGVTSTANWTDYTNGDTLSVGVNFGSVRAPLLKNSYKFAYDKNYAVDSAVFYSPNMKYSGTYTIASVSESKSLQALNVMGRTDACLTGWSLDKAGRTVIGTFDAEALRTLNAATATDTLYAVWS